MGRSSCSVVVLLLLVLSLSTPLVKQVAQLGGTVAVGHAAHFAMWHENVRVWSQPGAQQKGGARLGVTQNDKVQKRIRAMVVVVLLLLLLLRLLLL